MADGACDSITPILRPVGTMDRLILRRCTPCFDGGVVTPHPLATGHPDGACPVCGAPSLAGEPLEQLIIGAE